MTIEEQQKILNRGIEEFGDILVSEIRKQKYERVISELIDFGEIILEFLKTNETNHDRFKKLTLSQEIRENIERYEDIAFWGWEFQPEKFNVVISSFKNQINRIHEEAVKTGMTEASRQSVVVLYDILVYLLKTENNGPAIKLILQSLAEISNCAIKYDDGSKYSATFNWYIDLFLAKGDTIDVMLKKARFRGKGWAKDILIRQLKQIITEYESPPDVFRSFIAYLTEGTNISDERFYLDRFIDYPFPPIKETDYFGNLRKLEEEIIEKYQLLSSYNDLVEIKEITDSLIEELRAKELIERDDEIRLLEVLTNWFRRNDIFEISFFIISYCIFKRRYSYIRYLLNYNQPHDAVGIYVNFPIYPTNPAALFTFFFRKRLMQWVDYQLEDHSSAEPYHKRTFLVLLAQIIYRKKGDKPPELPELKNLDTDNVKFIIEQLKQIIPTAVSDLKELHSEDEGFDSQDIINRLQSFLDKVLEEIDRRQEKLVISTEISENKVQNFQKQFIYGYHDSSIITRILENQEAIKDETSEVNKDIRPFGRVSVLDKAFFFDEWHVDYPNMGKDYGKIFGEGKDHEIYNVMKDNCITIDKGEVKSTTETFANLQDLIILASEGSIFQFFKKQDFYVPQWKIVSEENLGRNFRGYLLIADVKIPIYAIVRLTSHEFLILNSKNLGKLIQYSPLDEDDSPEDKHRNFVIRIDSYSDNQELLDRTLDHADKLDWLRKIGDREAQKSYLLTQVRMVIKERYEFEIAENFEGYCVIL